MWRQDGYASFASRLREVDAGVDRQQLKAIVERITRRPVRREAAKLDEFYAFLSRMQVGDVVATTSRASVLGTSRGRPST